MSATVQALDTMETHAVQVMDSLFTMSLKNLF